MRTFLFLFMVFAGMLGGVLLVIYREGPGDPAILTFGLIMIGMAVLIYLWRVVVGPFPGYLPPVFKRRAIGDELACLIEQFEEQVDAILQEIVMEVDYEDIGREALQEIVTWVPHTWTVRLMESERRSKNQKDDEEIALKVLESLWRQAEEDFQGALSGLRQGMSELKCKDRQEWRECRDALVNKYCVFKRKLRTLRMRVAQEGRGVKTKYLHINPVTKEGNGKLKDPHGKMQELIKQGQVAHVSLNRDPRRNGKRLCVISRKLHILAVMYLWPCGDRGMMQRIVKCLELFEQALNPFAEYPEIKVYYVNVTDRLRNLVRLMARPSLFSEVAGRQSIFPVRTFVSTIP